MSAELTKEVARRRTFAIISHPDAGKTTLTEKLLLYGGAIHLAGMVKARRKDRNTTSDWMEIERERGISVTSSALQFEYNGYFVNILDTPGHKDFSEDTYRTLTAADSAVMLIDCAKGVEPQTIKLFEVCRMRGIPIFTFINKLDREGRDPIALIDEIENVLGIRSTPICWPLGMGKRFKGILDLQANQVLLYEEGANSEKKGEKVHGIDDPKLKELLDEDVYNKFREEIELVQMAGDAFDLNRVLAGQLSPLFFGSAMTNFGVQYFLERFIEMAPAPMARSSTEGPIDPKSDRFSAFVFKIQANMDPQHRDRVAFARVCSGVFKRGMEVKHSRMTKPVKLSNSVQFMANERVNVDLAYPGDVVGFIDTQGALRIGDTLAQDKAFQYADIPRFSPEHFVRVNIKDPMKRKQLEKGLEQLSEEGVVQIFYQPSLGFKDPYLGAVGALQFEVLAHRLRAEYGVETTLERLSFTCCRWIINKPAHAPASDGAWDAPTNAHIPPVKPGQVDLSYLDRKDDCRVLVDRDGIQVALFKNEWSLSWAVQNGKGLAFLRAAPPVLR
jgi:peptide chain release factor 3